ncbi:phospholipase A1-like [Haemaphysalis longicornis]
MRQIMKANIFSSVLFFFGICFAIDTSLTKTQQDIELRLMTEDESEILGPPSQRLQLLKKYADSIFDRQRLLLERSDQKTTYTSTFFDYIDQAVLTLATVIYNNFNKPNKTCYETVGCFYANESMSLPYGGPVSPEDVGTLFTYFTNASGAKEELFNTTFNLSTWTLASMGEDWNKRLVVITHGFTGNITTPWLLPLVRAFLENVTCNVIVADWGPGAEGPNYFRAAANTPMVGVEISILLQRIINATNCTLHPDNITLVGFSLGAHVMGFAGRHFQKTTSMKLGRIIGLDPAGALFQGTTVSLSRNDAKYVDIIHTNGGDIYAFKLGLWNAMGHVDFYPNGGKIQPNCSIYPKIEFKATNKTNSSSDPFIAFLDEMACSHYRAPDLLRESLTNHTCFFTSYPCPEGWENFDKCREEFKNNETVKGLMGYYSFTRNVTGRQYLATNNATPYCIPETKDTAGITVVSR